MTYRARPEDGIVWITGASSGVGRAVTLEMVRRGFRVAVSARRSEELEALAREAPDGRMPPAYFVGQCWLGPAPQVRGAARMRLGLAGVRVGGIGTKCVRCTAVCSLQLHGLP